MDIAGTDNHFTVGWSQDTTYRLVSSYFRHKWPEMCEELVSALAGDGVFFYKDQAARDSWDEYGRTDSNAGDMVYLLYDDDGFTLVTEDLDLTEVSNMVNANRCFA